MVSGSPGNAIETDPFSSEDHQFPSDSGHSYVIRNSTTDDGQGTTISLDDSDKMVFSDTGIFDDSDSGEEDLTETAGNVVSDTEGDTDTEHLELDPTSTETTKANDQIVSVDPTTGLRTTMKYVDHGSTDTVTKRDVEGFVDAHSASLTNPGSDIDSGSDVVTGTEQANDDIRNEIDVVGTLSTGEVVDLVDVIVLQDGMQDTFTTGDVLTTDGTNTDTSSLTGTVTISDLFHSFSGTIRSTDPSTGITTIHNFSDGVEGTSTDTLTEGDTRVIPVGGTSTDTPTSSDTGQLHQAWELKEVTSQTDASGNPVGDVTTTSDIGSDTETEQNGTVTDPGGTNVHNSSTTPAAATSPAALAILAPGDVLNDAESPPPGGSSTPPPSVKDGMKGKEIEVQGLLTQKASMQEQAANPQKKIANAANPSGGNWLTRMVDWLFDSSNVGQSGQKLNVGGVAATAKENSALKAGDLTTTDPKVAAAIGAIYAFALTVEATGIVVITVGVPGPEDAVTAGVIAAIELRASSLGFKLVAQTAAKEATATKRVYHLVKEGNEPATKKELNAAIKELKDVLNKHKANGPKSAWRSSNTWDTAKNSKLLRDNMGEAIKAGEDAHHIVQSTHQRAADARKLLDKYQIDINDTVNGVGLKPTGPKPAHHGHGLHSNDAIDRVTKRLTEAANGVADWASKRQALLDELAKLRIEIAGGLFP